jgi:[ribosomal protein S5]-alanine N-acetyltransferase
MHMELRMIHLNEDKANELFASADCQELIASMASFYAVNGFVPPWVGYFVMRNNEVVGTGGFVTPPADGKVELAYWTFKAHEAQGISSFTCRELIRIARETDPSLMITAKTAPEYNASTKILQKNGFEFREIVEDHEIGAAWLWVLGSAHIS